MYYLFILVSIHSFFHNYNCLKKKRLVYKLREKNIHILNDSFFKLQFKYWLSICIGFFLVALLDIYFSHPAFTFMAFFIMLALFPSFVNDILATKAIEKGYIEIEK